MKKRIICPIIGMVILLFLQFGREISINNSSNFTSTNTYELDLTINVNKIAILDKTSLAKELIRKCIDNDFKEVYFSYDLSGYPNKIEIDVYANEIMYELGIKSFSIEYMSKNGTLFNVKDNPEQFEMNIIEN